MNWSKWLAIDNIFKWQKLNSIYDLNLSSVDAIKSPTGKNFLKINDIVTFPNNFEIVMPIYQGVTEYKLEFENDQEDFIVTYVDYNDYVFRALNEKLLSKKITINVSIHSYFSFRVPKYLVNYEDNSIPYNWEVMKK